VTADGKVQILDVNAGKVLSALPEERRGECAAWHPSGKYLALVCSGREITVWDPNRMARMADLSGCRNAGVHVAFTPDGDRLLSQGYEGILRLWDWRTGRQVLQRPGGSNLRIRADGRLLVNEGSSLSLVELASGREYRSFVQQSKAGENLDYWCAHVHPAGRLLAVPMSDCTRLFDLETGDELASLPQSGYTLAFAENGALLTNGDDGLLRWPVRPTADPTCLQMGPPELLHAGTYLDIACDKKGEVIGQAARDGAYLVRPGKSTTHLRPHADARHITISPDGRYAATGNHGGEEGIKIWDAETGQLLVRLPLGSFCGGSFSPDGKWLAVSGTRGSRLVKVGTWETTPLDSGGLFSPDGSLFVTASARGVMRLLEPATGREFARLEDPNENPGSLAFTPDGARLIASSDVGRAIHVWDLRAIRRQLADMGLDWELPPYPEAEPPKPLKSVIVQPMKGGAVPQPVAGRSTLAEPLALLSLQISCAPYHPEPYHGRGHVYEARGEFEKAIADFTQALRWQPANPPRQAHLYECRAMTFVRLHRNADAVADLERVQQLVPDNAGLCNTLAWLLVTGPAGQQNPRKALPLARRSVPLEPGQWTYWNTLGVVHYRLAEYPQAVVALERSLREGKEQMPAPDLYFLAMSYFRLGDAAHARTCLERANRWAQQNESQLSAEQRAELHVFRGEAEAVLAGRGAQ
jgi:WD40 repeat protein/Flp pilus assembly protein TadD